ncbi:MAG: polysaccharide deacetylase family protein [Ginsengibacter sp.]
MYHRIGDSEADTWDIAVSPENLEEQLMVLKKTKKVVPLKSLVRGIRNKWIKKDSIAITFDDGYADNFYVAKPLLEKYQLPATFFIPSINIGQQKEFWWDELEQIILYTEKLPSSISITINDADIEVDLCEECILTAKNRLKQIAWKAYEQPPPTLRCKMFFAIWEALKPLNDEQQQDYLQTIRSWAGCTISARKEYQCMSIGELKKLAENKLFTIEAHSTTHPALAFHDKSFQEKELFENKRFLEDVASNKIETLAYPYGSYNTDTIKAAINAGFTSAFTTDEESVSYKTERFRIGRFQVKNEDSINFGKSIERWLTM